MTETKVCGELPTFRYTWPGEDEAVICVGCATKLIALARAIGLPLQLIRLGYKAGQDPMEFPTCPQQVKP